MDFSPNSIRAMPSKRIKLRPLAREDWVGIWDYSLENWSASTAEDYYNRIADRLEDLASARLIGLPVQDYPGTLKSLVGSHTIYYKLDQDALIVVRILHHSMDVSKKPLTPT